MKRSARKSKRASGRNRGQRGNFLDEFLVRKNVLYHRGVPPNVSDLERPYRIRIVSTTNMYTTTSGALSSNVSMTPTTLVDSFGFKWAACFRQYLVTGLTAVVSITRVGTAQGEIWARMEESSAAPSSAMTAAEKVTLQLSSIADNKMSKAVIKWEPRSAEDLTWTDVGSALNVAYLKLYSSVAVTGTASGDSTSTVTLQVFFDLAFRYFQ